MEKPLYEGEFYKLPACTQSPKPVQKPHPPIFLVEKAGRHFGGSLNSGKVGWAQASCRKICPRNSRC